MYQFTGAPHMARAVDDPVWIGQLTPNSMSAAPYRRAMLVLLDEWATNGTPPPASLAAHVATRARSITPKRPWREYPELPGVNLPKRTSRLPRYNYGPDFDKRGVMSVFPPEPVPGQEYPLRVPPIDADGNDIAGLRYPDVEVPLGTYNGWSLRSAGFAEGEQFWNTRQLRPVRPHAGRAPGRRRPAPLDRGALRRATRPTSPWWPRSAGSASPSA